MHAPSLDITKRPYIATWHKGSRGIYLRLSVPRPKVTLPEKDLLDRGEWHIAIISPLEYPAIKRRFHILPQEIRFATAPQYLGLGSATKGDDATYFIVVHWPEAQEFRIKNGLPKIDLHITIAFRKNDIHDVPKDSSTLLKRQD